MNQSIVEESIFRFLAILQMYGPDQCVNFVKAGVHLWKLVLFFIQLVLMCFKVFQSVSDTLSQMKSA